MYIPSGKCYYLNTPVVVLNGIQLAFVRTYKYLGTVMTCDNADDANTRRQRGICYARVNGIIKNVSMCSPVVKATVSLPLYIICAFRDLLEKVSPSKMVNYAARPCLKKRLPSDVYMYFIYWTTMYKDSIHNGINSRPATTGRHILRTEKQDSKDSATENQQWPDRFERESMCAELFWRRKEQ